MARWPAFLQLILARIREFYREPEAIFWVYGFPIILAVGLGIAFSGGEPPPPVVDVVGSKDSVVSTLTEGKVKVEVQPLAAARERLKKGKTQLYLVLPGQASGAIEYVYDPARSESVLARKWVEATLLRSHAPGSAPIDTFVAEPGSRYIDFLLPGLIGINLMGGGLFGVGFVLVDMRVRKLFKRLIATPMHRGDFLLSLLTARFLFLLPEMLALLLVGWFLFGVPVNGSPFALLVVILLGAAAFSGIGLLLGSRTEKTETMSGLMNLVMLPMYLLSGVFFSSARFPDEIQPIIQALPLTQLNDALREVMLEGAPLTDMPLRLGILGLYAVVTFALALRWFKWR